MMLMLILKPRMSALENPSQIEEARTVQDRSFFYPETSFTGVVANLMRPSDHVSLIESGCFEMTLPGSEGRGFDKLIVAGGFKNNRTIWTWGIKAKTKEGAVHLVTDVDLQEATPTEENKFDIAESGGGLVSSSYRWTS